ncbi:MAG: hypothetical protein IJ743_02280 [Bacilli bacterium]|nr:hypothetical protein [Bacilli bacterium]
MKRKEVIFMDLPVQVGESEAFGFCANTANVWQIVGYIFMVFKIVIPILLIIWGMLDLGKAVVGAKDDEIKKATKSLAMRAISAIIIFFLPTLVSMVMGLIGSFGDVQEDWKVCRTCITTPNGDCKAYAETAWES